MLEHGLWKSMLGEPGAGRGRRRPPLSRPVRGRRAAGAVRRRGRRGRRQARLQAHRAAAPRLARAGPGRRPRQARGVRRRARPRRRRAREPPGGRARGAHASRGSPPDGGDAAIAAALVEGTELGDLPLRPLQGLERRRRAQAAHRVRSILVGASDAARRGRARGAGRRPGPPTGPASCRTCPRTWSRPPTSPTARARSPSAHDRVTVEVMDRAEIAELGMGGLAGGRAREATRSRG